MIGIAFTTLSAAAIIIGTGHYYKTIGNIRLKELAFDRLKAYTEYHKGKIADNDILIYDDGSNPELVIDNDCNTYISFY